MSPGRARPQTDTQAGDDVRVDPDPRVLLFMRPGRDRELLVEALGDRYEIRTSTDVEAIASAFDCCVFDVAQFNRVAGTVQSKRDTSRPAALPFVLLRGDDSVDGALAVWEYVDDVIELPVTEAELHARVGNLVERRRTAVKLAEREKQLRDTVADLKLKEQALDEAPIGITIAEARDDDAPLVYANEHFQELTGYSEDIVGSDCRFLQGEETDPETIAEIREAIERREPVSVDVLNYRKSGQKFWNKLDVAPVHGDDEVTHFVGFQTDVTERKIRERRLEVLNRVLNHNLRNKMNVVQGYVTLLQSRDLGPDASDALAEIAAATDDLLGLAEAVQDIERTLTASASTETVVQLDDRIEQMVDAFEERFPAAEFELDLPAESSCAVPVVGLTTAIEEAVENAVKHNDSPRPRVEISVTRRCEEWIDIEITDDGPGIPEQELSVLQRGETPLQHADRLGVWLMYWVVSKAGGDFSVTRAEDGGTVVSFSVPTSR